jgi:hypothetical protein
MCYDHKWRYNLERHFDDTRSINYDRNTFIIQATGDCFRHTPVYCLRVRQELSLMVRLRLGQWDCHPYSQKLKSQHNYSQHNVVTTFSITTFTVMSLSIKGLFVTLSINDIQHKRHSAHNKSECRVSLCWVSFCWMSLCWVSLCWMSGRQHNDQIIKSKTLIISRTLCWTLQNVMLNSIFILYCWVSLCWLSEFWVLIFWVSLCSMSECLVY